MSTEAVTHAPEIDMQPGDVSRDADVGERQMAVCVPDRRACCRGCASGSTLIPQGIHVYIHYTYTGHICIYTVYICKYTVYTRIYTVCMYTLYVKGVVM